MSEVPVSLFSYNKSRIIFITRDDTFRGSVKVRFNKRDQSESEKLLFQSSGLTSGPQELGVAFVFNSVLKMTHGLPISLNAIGSRARFMVQEGEVESVHICLTVPCRDEKADQLLPESAFHNDKNEKMLSVLISSIDLIDNTTNCHASRNRFTELCVLRKRQ